MATPFIAEIRIFALGFAPQGWAFCDGALIAISQNTALFSILGTTYGGNGTSNFALPNLQGNIPIHAGQGPGLSPYVLGQLAGEASHTLTSNEIPSHTHVGMTTLNSVSTNGGQKLVGGNLPAVVQGTLTNVYSDQTPNATNTGMVASSGGPHNNLQPYLALNFCIALEGVFPSRN
jgi:microcystin-dependent protein